MKIIRQTNEILGRGDSTVLRAKRRIPATESSAFYKMPHICRDRRPRRSVKILGLDVPKSFPFSGQCNKIGVSNPDFVLDRPGGRSLHNGCNFHLSALDYNNGDGIQYTYDEKGRLIQQVYEDGVAVTYQYDNDGALASVTDSSSGITTRYFYDYTGRATKYTETGEDFSHTVAYTYNSDNNLSQLVETVNGTTYTTSYTYDKDNRITAKTTNGITEEYTYDALGRLTQQVIKNGDAVQQTKTYTYKSGTSGTSSQIATYTVASGAYSVTYTYQYDDNGNIISISDGSSLLTYAYDSANQIIRENTTSDDYTKVWTYDNAGNILTATEYDYSTGALGFQRDTVQYSYNDDSWGDLLTAFDGKQITYDEIGNPLTKGSTTYTWEHGRQLKSLSDGGETWTYTYNADGLRTGRTNGQRTYTYVYSGSQLTQMTVDGYTLEFGYDAKGTPLTLRFNNTLYYYITNIQGDVVGLQNTSGEKVLIYEYSAWGQVLYTNSADIPLSLNPLRYRGYVYDVETDLYYLQSRYYDPQMGRFLNADVVMDTETSNGFNIFAYVGNNPVLFVDYTGYGRTYVIYYDNPGSGFETQAENSPYYDPNDKDIYMIGVTTRQDFIDAWNNMEGRIDHVYLYLHGGKGVLYFSDGSLTFSGKVNFSKLNPIKVQDNVFLLSCKGGAGKPGNNVAWLLARLTKTDVYACTGSVSYSKIFGEYYARKALDFGFFKTFYYQKKYIFWGKKVARSLPGMW